MDLLLTRVQAVFFFFFFFLQISVVYLLIRAAQKLISGTGFSLLFEI